MNFIISDYRVNWIRQLASLAFLAVALAQGTSETTNIFQYEYLWALIVAFHLSFIFAFAMGANEVSNAFATSVSSGAISLRWAYVLATVVESAGGVLLGYKVLETLRFKVIDLSMYENKPEQLLLGQVAVLGGSALWMLSATLFSLPVSSTHSHIGSIIGFSLIMRGMDGLHWDNVIKIVVSWIVSPVLSGFISAVFYIIFDFAVFRRRNPLKSGFQVMPIFYFGVFTLNAFMVVYHGSKWIGFDKTPLWLAFLLSLAIGTLAALVFQFIIRGFLIKWVEKESHIKTTQPNESTQLPDTERSHFEYGTSLNRHTQRPKTLNSFVKWLLPDRKRINDQPTLRLFSAIQVFTGCFTGFSHGSKDIPNTIAPLATLLYVFLSHSVPKPQETPLWILIYGSLGTCLGFWMLGHRVIRTVGKDFTDINPFAGFCVELGAAITVLIASKLGIPISMTLCIVGSVVAVGAVRGSTPVNWVLFRNVFIAWMVTFPLSGLFSACIMFVLKYSLIK